MERDYKICFGEISFGDLFGKNNVEGMTFKTKGGRSRRRGGATGSCFSCNFPGLKSRKQINRFSMW